jgi:hypothetical protein
MLDSFSTVPDMEGSKNNLEKFDVVKRVTEGQSYNN